jgi:exonuclease 3'-5' domain-containing protein 1
MDVFLIDLGGKPDPGILKAVKELMETNMIVKIIHDCRMDCDALFHLHDIEVKNVHNTSCFHAIITGNQDKNLNDVLIYNGITPNAARDKSVYKRNPAFWATRPLTKHTTEWASFDVYKLFDLEVKQLERLEERQSQISVARAKSESNTTFARNMRVKTGLTVNSPGIFIG